jgi:predicted Zn-dependent protease
MSNIKKVYFAIGLNDSLKDKRVAGNITFQDNFLLFQTDRDIIKLPYNGVQSNRGGAGNNLIFFSHPSEPEWSIYTSDKSILRDLEIKNNPAFINLYSSRKKELSIISSLILISALLITFSIFGFYYFKEMITYFIASQIPISWEKKLGHTVFNSLTQGKKVYKDKDLIDQLSPITAPLFKATEKSGYEYEVYIIEDSRVNAFAMPGGIIVIHTELLKTAGSPEEIAGVLAHEISHITKKHGIRQMVNSLGIFLLVQTLFGDFTGLIAILTQNSGLLLASKFSRDYEREADASGFNILINSNINPQGMVDFFKKIQELEKEEKGLESEEVFKFFSTHPGTDERIISLQKEVDLVKLRKFDKIKLNLEDIRKKL